MTLNDFNEHFDTELESDDVDTIAGYYLTGVGAIPTQEVKEHYSVINKDKHLEFINDKVKDGRVTKLKVIITAAPEEAEEQFFSRFYQKMLELKSDYLLIRHFLSL